MSASNNNPLYFCPLDDKFIHLDEADLLVVSKKAKADLPKPGEPVAQANIVLRRAYETETEEIEDVCRYFWGETELFCFEQTFNIGDCVTLLALAEGETAGMLSWKKQETEQIIVVLNVYPEFQGQGIAKMLLKEAMSQARKQDCTRVKVATSNDDLPALYLYQKMGFRLVEVARNAVAAHHGEEFPGFAGIPVHDEWRLERLL